MADINGLKKTFPEAVRFSWEDVEELLWEVFIELRSSGYHPDVVIGVSRGGLAPARILTDYLQGKYVCTFQMGHWREDTSLREKPAIVFPLPEVDLSHKKVLVVDDVSDEGGTMEEVVRYLSPKVGEIRTAVLVSKADSRFQADYCPKVMKEWRWVLFPWSKHEDLRSRRRSFRSMGATIEEIRILESPCLWKSSREIEKVLFDMQQAGEVTKGKDRVWTLI